MEQWWNVTERGKLKNVLRKTPSEYHVNAWEPTWTVLALDKSHRDERPVN